MVIKQILKYSIGMNILHVLQPIWHTPVMHIPVTTNTQVIDRLTMLMGV